MEREAGLLVGGIILLLMSWVGSRWADRVDRAQRTTPPAERQP